MKNIIFILFFYGISIASLFSQNDDYNLKKSKIWNEYEKKFKLRYATTNKTGEVITVNEYEKANLIDIPPAYQINYFDDKLNLITTKTLSLKSTTIIGLIVKGDSLHLVSISRNKQKGIDYSLLSSELGKEMDFEERTLFSIDKKGLLPPLKVFNMNEHLRCCGWDENSNKLVFSENQEYIAIIGKLDVNRTEARRIHVLDKNLHTVVDYLFKSGIKEKDFTFQDFNIDNKGNVYLLGKIKGKKRKKKPNYYYQLYKVNKEGSTKIKIDTEDLFVNSLRPIIRNDRLSCVGFCSKMNNHGMIRIDVNMDKMESTKLSFSPFTEQFFRDKYGKVKSKKYKSSFEIKNVFMLENGDVIVNGEETSFSSYIDASNRNHYDDMIIVKINTEGSILWNRVIKKDQTSSATGKYLSYTSCMRGNNNFIFVNTRNEMKKLKDGRNMLDIKSFKSCHLWAIKLSKDGKINFKKLINTRDEKIYFEVLQGIVPNKYTGKDIFLQGSKKSRKQLLKISFE